MCTAAGALCWTVLGLHAPCCPASILKEQDCILPGPPAATSLPSPPAVCQCSGKPLDGFKSKPLECSQCNVIPSTVMSCKELYGRCPAHKSDLSPVRDLPTPLLCDKRPCICRVRDPGPACAYAIEVRILNSDSTFWSPGEAHGYPATA
uniref:Uncharacterized protein n=1 Tax=Molossus molossus TaxID=27622 RepID=A0A7J8J6N2_MOLMO|nr:hypothetical protein HJG59_009703 [Molossus molossus]